MSATVGNSQHMKLPQELHRLGVLIDDHPESFATGNDEIQTAALQAAKYVFDLALKSETESGTYVAQLASSLNPFEAPHTRSQTRAANGKRRRSPSPPPSKSAPAKQESVLKPSPLASLYIEGMDEDQIWAQLELRAKNVCDALKEMLDGTTEEADVDMYGEEGRKKRKVVRGDGEAREMMDEDEEDESEEDESSEDEDEESDDGKEIVEEEGVTELRDPSSSEDEEGLEYDDPVMRFDLDRAGTPHPRSSKKADALGLNDGFFDLDAFNAETEEAEARMVSRGRLGRGDDDEDDDDEEIDWSKPVDETNDMDNMDGDEEPFYNDFFAPPKLPKASGSKLPKPRRLDEDGRPVSKITLRGDPVKERTSGVRFHEEVKVKTIKAKGKGRPVWMVRSPLDADDDDEEDEEGSGLKGLEGLSLDEGDLEEDGMGEFGGFGEEDEEDGSEDEENDSEGEEADDDDEDFGGRDTIERLKDDLFAEEEAPHSDLSTHEQRMASLREQIQELEAENVGKKDWTLMGEATARSRPQNSLLEEDLEFERVQKAVPVVTEETVHTLEERIKSRILAGQFDDVVRKRPLDDKPFLPSRYFELKDTKSEQSLAQIYEDEYQKAAGEGVGDDRDGKLRKEHEEIEKMWEGICNKLDALSNVHFTPKQPKASISTVSNISAATLESALPTSKATTTMLAPEEVYAPVSAAELRAKSELTPAEKKALRNKQRKQKKKARDALDKSVDKYAKKVGGAKSVKKAKEEALKSVVKSGKGVTVVGKKREDVIGKKDRRK